MSLSKVLTRISNAYPLFLKNHISKDSFSLIFPLSRIPVKGNEKQINNEQVELGKLANKHKGIKLNTLQTTKGTLVESIEFLNSESYLSFIGKTQDFRVFCNNLEPFESEKGQIQAILLQWASKNVLQINNFSGKWNDILLCVHYFLSHKSSNLYLRELPIAVHSKFIEKHKKIIENILLFFEEAVSFETETMNFKTNKEETITSENRENNKYTFEKKYAIKTKPDFVRFRFLDESLKKQYFGISLDDIYLPLASFEQIIIENLKTVFIVENEINYLTFPTVLNSIILWGSGFKALQFQNIAWLQNKNIWYFGDLDSHGFKILSLFRKNYQTTKSFCMDESTFQTFEKYSSKGETIGKEEFNQYQSYLTPEEWTLANLLNSSAGRLEQENISQDYIVKKLKYQLKIAKSRKTV